MNIAIAGIGYVGLASAVLLAQHNDVIALDINALKVDLLNSHKAPLDDNVAREMLASGKLSLRATTDPREAFDGTEIIVVATPTDFDEMRNGLDTSVVESVISQALRINPQALIVIKSTVPVGFTDAMRHKNECEHILFSPEFSREGQALHDMLHPSRIIVGASCDSARQLEQARRFAALCRQGAKKKSVPILLMRAAEAEAVKLFANAYLAMRVAFFNELDAFAEVHGLDPGRIIRGVGLDSRIGAHYHNPSFGYGGYCLPKDVRQLLAGLGTAPGSLLRAVIESNRMRKDFVTQRILGKLDHIVKPAPVIGIYRLSMKAASDNFRQSAVLGVLERLKAAGVDVVIYDPALKETQFQGARVCHALDDFLRESDVIVANRYDEELKPFLHKVYTRDLYHMD